MPFREIIVISYFSYSNDKGKDFLVLNQLPLLEIFYTIPMVYYPSTTIKLYLLILYLGIFFSSIRILECFCIFEFDTGICLTLFLQH